MASKMDTAKVENNRGDSNDNSGDSGRDEVDFVVTKSATEKEICVSCTKNPIKKGFLGSIRQPKNSSTSKCTSVYGDCELQTAVKSQISQLFHFPLRKKSENESEKIPNVPPKPRLIKSSSIARLFGNTYSTSNTKKPQVEDHKPRIKKSHSVNEKFSNRNLDQEEEFVLRVSDLSASTMSLLSDGSMVEKPENKIKSFTKGIGKLLRRNCSSVEISAPDPEYKVLYLGNVLTGWAKGELKEFVFFLE